MATGLRRKLLHRLWVDAPKSAPAPQAPLRAALLTAEQMRAHGRQLARQHELAAPRSRNPLLGRLQANQSALQDVAKQLSAAVSAARAITPAGEWLLDNFYLIEEEIATAKRHLPARYSRELPRLNDDVARHGTGAGQPRVYDLALNAVAHGDGRLVMHTLSLFVSAYQTERALTLGELWALPIMLRLALIENLRRIGVAVASSQRSRDSAERWAERMLAAARDEPPSDLVLVVADLARSGEALDTSFVAELARRLQGRGAAMAMPISWLEQRLRAQGRTLETSFVDDSREQAEWQLSVANSIGSLRLVDAGNWSEFVEDASLVEHILREDPAAAYARMDFASRDGYRHAVERLARRSGKTELDIAREVLALATRAKSDAPDQAADPAAQVTGDAPDERESHVGYYLVALGRQTLERHLGLRPSWSATAKLRAHAAAVTLSTLLLSWGPAWFVWQQTELASASPWLAWLFVSTLLLGASQLAVAIVNWIATLLVTPRMLARLDFGKGISTHALTLVAVPTLLTRAETIDALLETVELHYLANRDPQLRFALLSDLRDAPAEHEPGDDALVERAAAGIAVLNARYAPARGSNRRDIFFLLHRPRRYNAREGVWMGHERKRGKLSDLNALVRGRAGVGPGKPFARIEGDLKRLAGVRYVITLDSDTELPHGSAAQLAATMAHPLQRPRFGVGACAGLVVEGHAILQPRSKASLPSTLRSRHARLIGADAGTDPYTRAVSDVYQDLFDEGSYIGKGIYDVDAFERALAGRLPDDRVLSHDLIEGCHARSGLLSDVTLFEQVPQRHATEVARIHRWTRGDWQLLPWLFGRVGALPGRPLNILSPLSRLKLFDNLRRSLVPPALLLLLLLGWTVLPAPALWSLIAAAVLGLVPMLVQASAALRSSVQGGRGDLGVWRMELWRLLQRAALLPDEARNLLDAIGRTLWRVLVSRRRLLEWTASTELPSGAPAGSSAALLEALRQTWTGPLLASGLTALLATTRPDALVASAPWLGLWALAPLLVWWLDQPARRPAAALSARDRRYLRGVARRTWAFFEDQVGPETHHLPPDNVQWQPAPRIAHRTSPTNIGMALLAPLVARDLGYLLLTQLLARIDAQLGVLEGLPRYRGHFFNWYDTQTLEPLPPRYVSSVDSGNLAASLLVLRSGLLALADEPISDVRWCHGIRDTLDLYLAADGELGDTPQCTRLRQQVDDYCDQPRGTLREVRATLEAMHESATELAASVASHLSATEVRERSKASLRWAQALTFQCRAAIEEMSALLPPGMADSGADGQMPSLRALAADSHATPQAARAFEQVQALAARAAALSEADYDFLFDRKRRMLHIGWHVDDQRPDAGFYDLLASEARLGVYVAIAQNRLPVQAWFALGRGLSLVEGSPVLMSWSGSMFEYLMPALLMPQYEDTLLARSCAAAVGRQIAYGKQRGVPWGISESGYNAIDSALNYQYRAFGVPGLGLKRGLGDDLVIAPYATAMALIVEPALAVANLRRLNELGADDDYGYFEALDFTRARLPPDKPFAIVRQVMAHHQGMALLALGQALNGERMQQRFMADPELRAMQPLLHERAPVGRVEARGAADSVARRPATREEETHERTFDSSDTPAPQVHLLSNGRYHLLLTQAGAGYSRWRDVALTRWREDTTQDNWGSFCYLRDLDSGKTWSNAHQPTRASATRERCTFSEGRAEYRRLDDGIETHTTIAVSPEDDIELRRVRLTNTTRHARGIELTTYAEVVLTSAAADAQHPAFNKLFVMTEVLQREGALLAWRRPRSETDRTPWMFHLLNVHAPDRARASLLEVSHETDRARFIGRGRDVSDPLALHRSGPLSNTAGAVLDPVLASRCVLRVDTESSRTIDLVTGVAASREECLALIHKYRDRRLADRVFELAWTHAQVMLRQLDIGAAEAQLFSRIAGLLVYAQPTLRADGEMIRKNRRGQSGLWGYSISGDLPIVLVTITDSRRIELVRQLLQAHAWWRQKGLAVDLVIWNQERDTYRQRLHEQILGLVGAGREASTVDRPGGVFVRNADQIAPEDRMLLMSVARAVFSDERGTLTEQLQHSRWTERRLSRDQTRTLDRRRRALTAPQRHARHDRHSDLTAGALASLTLTNGYGGFDASAREYVITGAPGRPTPAPWVNVLANPRLGSVVSESGSAYTWFGNAHEFRLTPWLNDPVTDACGEAFYIRDEDSGAFWSPTTLPAAARPTLTRHGPGKSTFEQEAFGIRSTLTLCVAADAPVRLARIELRNTSAEARRLSATAYVEWVLGSQRATSAPHVVCETDATSGALFARNAFRQEHSHCVAFLDVDDAYRDRASVTCDRTDFIGRNRSLRDPRAMHETRLSGRQGAALDPCAAIQVEISLAPGESRSVVFRLGAGDNEDEARALIERFRRPQATEQALEATAALWRGVLDTIQVETPDPTLDALVNTWLPYQICACRLWARSGYYQSGGAFGFRDQLQDAMALVHSRPDLLRDQLLRCAGRQFPQGDVQHWWHPPGGQGVRSTCSDDYLWLPWALVRYWRCSADRDVLDQQLPFIEGRPVPPGDESYYDVPQTSQQTASLYQHARLAIEHGLRFGVHGLPLMGGGDWNDGMNRVGAAGRGESVWLAFFLCRVMRDFAPLAAAHGDTEFAARCEREAATLAKNIEGQAWDGQWYRRAWFDDGTPLGSAASPECRIDLIAQSWAVLSGVAPPDRASCALQSVQERLVDRDHRLVRLLEPPFDGAGHDPGYIAGYVPGVRENGGQYTHGAVWAAMALAEAGRTDEAWAMFDLINPMQHARDEQQVQRYKVEPYVVAADVYSVGEHAGRGGWTWYTGSAGWMYRLIVESLLGLQLDHDGQTLWLVLEPSLPTAWGGFTFTYRHGTSAWRVQVQRDAAVDAPQLSVDGELSHTIRLALRDDGVDHAVVLRVPGPAATPAPAAQPGFVLHAVVSASDTLSSVEKRRVMAPLDTARTGETCRVRHLPGPSVRTPGLGAA